MKIAVDCEFNGFGGQLISMALVADDERIFYGVLDLPDDLDPWVAEHVVPYLKDFGVDFHTSYETFRDGFKRFLGKFDDIVIVADWYTDLVHFFEVYAGKDHSESFHIPLKAELLPDMEFLPSEVPHNALADARAIMATLKSRAA